MKDILKSIDPDLKRGWTITINGKNAHVNFLELYNPNHGKVIYGQHPNGYDGWFFSENQGGGAIIVIYFFHGGKLFVSMLLENRVNMGGEVWCGIGGYLRNEESDHPEIDMAEILFKKTHLSGLEIKAFPGKPVNSNRSIFVSTEECALDCYYAEISTDQVMPDPNDKDLFILKNSACERLKFVEWSNAMNYSQDAFICILGYKLLSKLHTENKVHFSI